MLKLSNINKKIISKVLIWMGVLAWLPYFILKFFSEKPVLMAPFLAVHLIGVLGGGSMKLFGKFK